MPVNQTFDFALDDKPFMLARTGHARAWHRTGVPDIPTRRLPQDQQYGNLPDTLDHPEVIDDWSGGPGEFRRSAAKPNAYGWSINMDTRFPGMMVHSQAPQLLGSSYYSGANINAQWFVDVPLVGVTNPPPGAGAVLALGRGYVAAFTPTAKQDLTGSAQFDLAIEATGGGSLNFGQRAAIYGSFVFIPNTDGSAIYRRNLSDATYTLGTAATLGTSTWFGVGAQQMWYPAGPHVLRPFISSEGNLLNGVGLGATINVGNGYFNSRDGVQLEDQMYVGMPEGLYQGNLAGTFNNVVNDLLNETHIDNFADLTTHQGYVVGAAGPHIWAFKPSTIQSDLREIGPPWLGITPFAGSGPRLAGRFTCVRSYGAWLYAGMFTGSGSIFWAGIDQAGRGPFTWYPLHDFLGLNVKVRHLHVDSITSSSGGVAIPRRIWAATDASWGAAAGATAPIFFWQIPEGDANPIFSPAFIPNFMGSAEYESPWEDWQAPGTLKYWRVHENLGSTVDTDLSRTWASLPLPPASPLLPPGPSHLRYQIDKGAVFTLGKVSTFMYFSQNAAGPGAGGYETRFHLDSFPGGVTNIHWSHPIWRGFVTRGIVTPHIIDTIESRVRIATGMLDRRGGHMRPRQNMINELRGMATSSASQKLTDLNGVTQWVKVQGPIEEEEWWQQGQDEPEVIATVRMSVLSFTTGLAP